jgi:hypothetical protein
MKLIGNGIKDYYDYLIHQYGEDPLVILDRRPIGEFKNDYNNKATGSYSGKHVDKIYGEFKSDRGVYDRFGRLNSTEKWLVLNGRVYPVVRASDYKFELANEDNSTEVSRSEWWFSRFDFTKTGVTIPSMVKLSKELNRHCFIFDDGNKYVYPTIPNLSEIGFTKVKQAQEVYLETVDFISEHFAKEMEQIVQMNDREKIVSHGFDLKKSFRGKN